jgi:hypothetical protein
MDPDTHTFEGTTVIYMIFFLKLEKLRVQTKLHAYQAPTFSL